MELLIQAVVTLAPKIVGLHNWVYPQAERRFDRALGASVTYEEMVLFYRRTEGENQAYWESLENPDPDPLDNRSIQYYQVIKEDRSDVYADCPSSPTKSLRSVEHSGMQPSGRVVTLQMCAEDSYLRVIGHSLSGNIAFPVVSLPVEATLRGLKDRICQEMGWKLVTFVDGSSNVVALQNSLRGYADLVAQEMQCMHHSVILHLDNGRMCLVEKANPDFRQDPHDVYTRTTHSRVRITHDQDEIEERLRKADFTGDAVKPRVRSKPQQIIGAMEALFESLWKRNSARLEQHTEGGHYSLIGDNSQNFVEFMVLGMDGQ